MSPVQVKVGGTWRSFSQGRLKLGGAQREIHSLWTKVNGQWRLVWPTHSSMVRITGVAYTRKSQPFPGVAGTDHLLSFPAGSPRYLVAGDASQIHSARVEIRMTPSAPKSPVEHTFSWDVTHDWGIYHVSWRVDASTVKYYYAAMTHSEAAAIVPPKYANLVWSPRTGGWFAYMPACWDTSGLVVPVRDDAAGGLDAHTGYAPFPPGRAATSALADYSVANGYTDMLAANGFYGYNAANIASLTIILRNSGGGVLSQWGPAAIDYTDGVLVPGTGNSATFSAPATASLEQEFYWPPEWRGLFDYIPLFDPYSVRWGRDIPNKGEGEWDVFDGDGVKIGDFRLALRPEAPGQIEIRGVNLQPDLVGMRIMRHIVEYGVTYCPTENVIIHPPDPATKAVMESWGWQNMTELSPLSMAALPNEYRQSLDECLWIWSNPMYNRFVELGLPTWDEVTP